MITFFLDRIDKSLGYLCLKRTANSCLKKTRKQISKAEQHAFSSSLDFTPLWDAIICKIKIWSIPVLLCSNILTEYWCLQAITNLNTMFNPNKRNWGAVIICIWVLLWYASVLIFHKMFVVSPIFYFQFTLVITYFSMGH